MPELETLTEDEALNRLSLVANGLSYLAEMQDTGLRAALSVMSITLEECLAVLEPPAREH